MNKPINPNKSTKMQLLRIKYLKTQFKLWRRKMALGQVAPSTGRF